MPHGQPLQIGMILFPGLMQLDLTGPYEVFASLPESDVLLIAETSAPVRSAHGLSIIPTTTFADAPQCDLLCVPGGTGVDAMMEHAPLLSFLAAQAQGARYVTSVCTGALLLGSAGLLQGYRAATHWLSMDLLPILGAEPVHERVVIDRNRITGGGVTAGIDFGLVVATELYGEAVAQRIQLMLEYNPSPPFQSGSPAVADPALVEEVRRSGADRRANRRQLAERAAANIQRTPA